MNLQQISVRAQEGSHRAYKSNLEKMKASSKRGQYLRDLEFTWVIVFLSH